MDVQDFRIEISAIRLNFRVIADKDRYEATGSWLKTVFIQYRPTRENWA